MLVLITFAVDWFDGDTVEVEVFKRVEIYCHHGRSIWAGTVAKGLDTTRLTETMVNAFFIELVGGQIVFTGEEFELRSRYEGGYESLPCTVRTVTFVAFSDLCFNFVGHCAAVTAAFVCLHGSSIPKKKTSAGVGL